MERVKAEVEKRVSKILKFVRNKNKIPKESKKELLGLVQDLHEQCQSLYSIFDDIQEASDGEPRGRKGKSCTASSTSSSDLEYYSSEETDSNAGNVNEAVVENPSVKEKTETPSSEVVDLKRKLEVLNLECVAAFRKLQEAEFTNKNLSSQAGEKERELSARIKELERQLGDVQAELLTQYDQKGDLEEQIVMKASENKQLGEKNKGLCSRISGLELVLKEKGDEMSTLVNKFGKSEIKLTSRIEDLKSQVSNLQLETDFLRAQNGELAGSMEGKRNEELKQFKSLMDQVNVIQNELASLRSQKNEVQSQLDKKTDEVLRTQKQLKHLQEEIERQVNNEQKVQEETEDLWTKAQKLEQEVNSLRKQKNETDEQLKSKIKETNHLREKNEKLRSRIGELDSSQMEREKKNLAEMEDQSTKINNKVADQQKLVKEQDDIIRSLSVKIKEQQRLLKEQKDTIDKYSEDQKIIKRWSFGSTRDSKLNLNLLERKMEELAEDFRMKMEDHIRILYRRIHVAEQIHLESKNNYMKTRETIPPGQENKETHKCCETQIRRVKNMLQPGLPGSDMAIKKLDETRNYVTRVSKIIKEINSARNWVKEKNNEMEQMKHEVETLVAQLECREAQESLLKEKLSKLEAKLAEEGTEKLSLAKVLSKFEMKIKELEADVKAKEAELISLGEEKREAIRQLCVLVDYQRCRYDNLKRSIPKVAP